MSKKHKIGDTVRLVRGWTPMTVIGFSRSGDVIAQYSLNPSVEDFEDPECAQSAYARPHSGFVRWDGPPLKGYNKMPKRFQLIGTPMIGTFMQRTTQGFIALEFDDGSVGAFDPQNLTEIIPMTFSVKATDTSYRTHYILPEGKTVAVNDLLLSDQGTMFIVTAVDTRSQNEKGVFKGSRVLTERF